MRTAISKRAEPKPHSKEPEINVRLVVQKFDCAPDEITGILGVKPTLSWRRGDPVSWADRLTAGRAVPQRKYNTWVLEAPNKNSRSLADHVDGLLKQILPVKPKFDELPRGVDISVNCAIYDYERSTVLHLPSKSLRAIAELGADLNINYYDMTDWEE